MKKKWPPCALCDAVDAMTSERPYRPPLSWQQCRQEIVAGKAGQFDAVLVEAAEKLWPVWERTYSAARGVGTGFSARP
ncbi:hypothetical protein [Desulfofundulus thermobenzoicus]|uniref:hypothetical protein n=1 Tax=Desulfofundulus thermobenzoicus TaxID=29376 RepID=UPI001FA9BEA3|nr:hypothetical protein [Desulfofundulus thermobenzoicus]